LAPTGAAAAVWPPAGILPAYHPLKALPEEAEEAAFSEDF